MRIYDIEPKPTVYYKTEYRSRLEARWAVFFDTLRIKHEYEKESFLIGNKYYLPDFWIKNWIIEIKPNNPTPEEYYKARMVSYKHNIAILAGLPGPDVVVYLFSRGHKVYTNPTKLEMAYCMVRGLSAEKWNTLKALQIITDKKRFTRAFENAERFQF